MSSRFTAILILFSSEFLDLWEYYLPYLYSGISLFGVLLFLCTYCCHLPEQSNWITLAYSISFCVSVSSVCTPFGLSRMFSVIGSLLVKPRVSPKRS